MVRVEFQKLVDLQQNCEKIRNICILAHVDHGKTTLADSLIASNGIISQKLAGKLRYMDSRPDEQERQITMKSSSIALFYNSVENEGDEYLINLIDSPGHVDFSSEVSTAVRLCDGAIIVVDVVEGVCPQTRICLKQAYNESLKTVLLLNKIDRLILEKKMTPLEAYKHLTQVLEQINAVVGNIFASDVISKEDMKSTDQTSALEESDDSFIYYTPQNGNVIFGSALDGWGFTVKKFAKMYENKLGLTLSQLEEGMWGDFFYSSKKKSVEKGAFEKGKKPLFVQLILDNIWNIYELIENKDVEKLKAISEKLGITQSVRDLKHSDSRIPIKFLFSQWLPMEKSILEMILKHVPNPATIPDSKAEKLLCSSIENFKSYPEKSQILKKDILNCDPKNENIIVFISKMFPVDQKALPRSLVAQLSQMGLEENEEKDEIFLAFARVYSGTLTKNSKLFVIGPKYDPRQLENINIEESPHISEVTIGSLFILMGRSLEEVDSVRAGNIVGISGLQNNVLKTATLSNNLYCPPFVDLPMIATPILRVAVEPKDIQNMPKLVKGLKLLNQADACVQVLIQETGEHVLLTLGEVHLERCIKDLEESYAKIELNVSKPIVPFRETIVPFASDSEENAEAEVAKEKEKDKSVTVLTPNKQCSLKFLAVPLPPDCVELLEKNTLILKALSEIAGTDVISQNLHDSITELKTKLQSIFKESDNDDLNPDLIEKIWSVGPKKCGTNLLINESAYKNQNIWNFQRPNQEDGDQRYNYDSSFVNGFQMATLSGPLCDEPMQGICFIVKEWVIESVEDSVAVSHGPLSGQIMSAAKEGCKKSFQTQPQRLVAPMYSCNITVNSDVLGKMYAVIGRRHGRILSADLIEGSGQFDVSAVIPVIESFNFAKEIRKQTSGLAMPQLVFSHWEIVDIDPYWVPKTEEEYLQYGEKADFTNIAKVYMDSIRERKGLAVEKKTVEFAEKQRTLSKNK